MKSPGKISSDKKTKDNKKTHSNCYSLTIRTGNGILLGSNTVIELFTWLKAKTEWVIISLEKDENEAHFQGGLFYSSPKRQDHLRADIMTFVEKMYIDCLGDKMQTEKGLLNMRKHALALVPHNDFENLVRYTLKEGLTPGRTPVISKLPKELKFYVPEQYCEHDEISFYCSICYKQESDELSYFERGQYWTEKQYRYWFTPYNQK